jgi:hypothetical protein
MRRRQKRRLRTIATLTALASFAVAGGVADTASASQADYDQGYALGLEAYKYGFPLVTTQKTFANQTSINVSNGRGFGPVNKFNPVRSFSVPTDRSVVAPNLDTLYSIAWLDLKKQPQVIHVPKVKNRYFVIPLMSPYTEDFKNLGSVPKTKPGDYAVVGPKQAKKKLPKGVKRIKSQYNRVWIIERTYADPDNSKDVKKVNQIQNEIKVRPLSAYGVKGWKRKKPKHPDTTVDNVSLPTGLAYYDQLGQLLSKFPPPAEDQAELDKLAAIGVGPGATPSSNPNLSADTKAGMTAAAAAGVQSITSDALKAYLAGFDTHNGYLVMPTGNYGTDYIRRAIVTQVGLGALVPDQAIYPLAQVDHTKAPLTGAKKYTLHIPAGGLPPVNAFWSMTMYDLDGFLVPNPINRYVINNRTNLHYNSDGSLDLYVQNTQPSDPAQAQNWLPSPPGQFRLIWRLYGTQQNRIQGVLDGTGWNPPAITQVP